MEKNFEYRITIRLCKKYIVYASVKLVYYYIIAKFMRL